MAQRQKHSQKSSFKFEKSKVNKVILLYKNNAKTYPFLQGLFFFFYGAPKIISIILLCKLKEKEEKTLNKRSFFFSDFKGKKIFLVCIIKLNDNFTPINSQMRLDPVENIILP